MSVFRGSITEYPGVVVDHFIPVNCEKGKAFFLSHCHRDHMTGLSSPAIVQALRREMTNFYCSEVTKCLLSSDPEFTSLAPYLESLPMEQPVAMAIGSPPGASHSKLSFTVTLLPAGHCPGSVMFLFQGSSGNVLYTGDFRLTLEETRRIRPLHASGRKIDIDALYLDTTFCHPVASKIPSRAVSRDHVLKIMEEWLSRHDSHVVRLHCSAFGYEHMYMGITKKFNTKIHIAEWKMNAYAKLPAVRECLTSDGDSTRIHNCIPRRGRGRRCGGGLPCGSHPVSGRYSVLHIKPSTIWFLSTQTLAEPSVFIPRHSTYRVLHSMHASFSELIHFVKYLKPSRVVPCVVALGDTTLSDVQDRLKSLLPHSNVVASVVVGGDDTAEPSEDTDDTDDPNDDSTDEGKDSNDGETTTFREFKEKLNKRQPFSSHARLPVAEKVVLPSMLMPRTSGVIAAPSSAQHSSVSSGSVTVGSLEQTSLDLSLDSVTSSPASSGEEDVGGTGDESVASSPAFVGGGGVGNESVAAPLREEGKRDGTGNMPAVSSPGQKSGDTPGQKKGKSVNRGNHTLSSIPGEEEALSAPLAKEENEGARNESVLNLVEKNEDEEEHEVVFIQSFSSPLSSPRLTTEDEEEDEIEECSSQPNPSQASADDGLIDVVTVEGDDHNYLFFMNVDSSSDGESALEESEPYSKVGNGELCEKGILKESEGNQSEPVGDKQEAPTNTEDASVKDATALSSYTTTLTSCEEKLENPHGKRKSSDINLATPSPCTKKSKLGSDQAASAADDNAVDYIDLTLDDENITEDSLIVKTAGSPNNAHSTSAQINDHHVSLSAPNYAATSINTNHDHHHHVFPTTSPSTPHHHNTSLQNGDSCSSPIVINSSSSSSESGGSCPPEDATPLSPVSCSPPDILPPTPGKELDTICQRKGRLSVL